MPRTVIILGAGASKPGGCPVLSEFIPTARKLSDKHMLGSAQESFEALEVALERLHAVNSNFNTNLNIETLLSILDIIISSSVDTFISVNDADTARKHLVRIIVATLEATQKYEWVKAPSSWQGRTREGLVMSAPRGYQELSNSLRTLFSSDNLPHVTFVTFNYDLGLEYALKGFYYPGISPYFENESHIPICKMHGSMNWYRSGDKVVYHPKLMYAWFESLWESSSTPWFPGQITSSVLPHGQEPFIVAPSHDKFGTMGLLSSARRVCADAIKQADLILFCGYSLSITDGWFRNLLKAYTPFSHKLRAIRVYDTGDATRQTFREFFGSALRDRVTIINGGIVEMSDYIASIGGPEDSLF